MTGIKKILFDFFFSSTYDDRFNWMILIS